MIARSSWGARADEDSDEKREEPAAEGAAPPVDDLLDARFDAEGHLEGPREEAPRPPEKVQPKKSPTVDELDLAVQRLSKGLEAIDQKDRARPAGDRSRAATGGEAVGEGGSLTNSLDRLEARLEALSKRLEQGGPAPARSAPPRPHREEPSARDARDTEIGRTEDTAAQLAESRRLAEAEEAVERLRRAGPDIGPQRGPDKGSEERSRQTMLSEALRNAEAVEARRESELAAVRRDVEAAEKWRQSELAQAKRLTEQLEAQRRAEFARRQSAIETRGLAEVEAEAEKLRREAKVAADEQRRRIEEVEAARRADLAEARREADAVEKRRRAEMEETKKHVEAAAARREAELAASVERQFAELETRIDALQEKLDSNQIEPVRADLLDLVKDMAALSRGRRTTGEALAAIKSRLDEMEVKLNAARNMAGNRLGDIQDRLSGLVERIDGIEVEIPGFDALRENQHAILERFDRMEGLVNRLASAEELLDRVDGLKRQLQTTASQREVAQIEEQLLKLAERLDALPAELNDEESLGRIEASLGGVATDLVEARRQRKSVALAFEDQLADLSKQLRQAEESGRTPDLSGIEDRISVLGTHLAEDRRSVGDAFTRMERRLETLAAQVEKQEDEARAEILSTLTEKLDLLAAAVAEQDTAGTRRDIGGLDRKLDELAEQFAARAKHLSQRQIEPLESRIQEMHGHIEEIAKRAQDTSALFKPLVRTLQEISERLGGLGAEGTATPLSDRLEAIEERVAAIAGKSSDPRGLQTQLEAIVSRLEILKGRSVDPARLNELFDRIESAVRALPEERFEEGAIPDERLARLERKIAETAKIASGESFERLEQKLDGIGRVFAGGEAPASGDLAELRSDIASLRRELRDLPAATQAEPNLGELMRAIAKRLDRLPQEQPASSSRLEAQIERISHMLDDPQGGPAGLARIEASLRTIEKRLDDTRRSLGYHPPREVAEMSDEERESVAGLARALSEDVSSLKNSAQAAEQKTKDTIDAVQDTLEAVVKRMAFLEGETEPSAAPSRPEPPRPEPMPAVTAAPPAPEPPEAPSGGGLLSRFTSRQLLRRATGGRAESFSPEPEEIEEPSDLPLEPGTDSPLDSSLTGAPSSDTELMSGGRKPHAAKPRARGRPDEEPPIDDSFLAAARRAARAAAEEVAETEDHGEGAGGARHFRHRGAIVGALLAAALVVAAVVIVRSEVWPFRQIMALIGDESASVEKPATELSAMPAATETRAAPMELPAPQVAEAPAAETPAAETLTASAPDLRPEELSAANTAAAGSASQAPAMSAAETTSAIEPAQPAAEVAATEPTSQEPAAMSPQNTSLTASLPELIGPAQLRDAALGGDRIAEFEVGARYAEGRGVPQDMLTAVVWYEKSADAGLAPAQYRLGSIYEKGLGVPRDLAKAQEWYRRAADAGNVKAMHNLAVLYAEGAGGAPDLERAALLFREAAEHGVRDSQFNLAILHARGLGVPQDLVEAYKWFAVAASSGDEELAKRRDIIAQALSDADRARAEQEAATFQPLPLVSDANEVLMPDNGWRSDDSSTSVEVKSGNDLVALVQKLLAENGYDPGPADGLLGEKTIEAISAFQDRAGLPKTGQIDTDLVAALRKRPT